MAKLITNHDPYHVHKILGVLVLLNTLLRLCYTVRFGTAFPDFEPAWVQVAATLVHGLLSCSSLLLPLPRKRNRVAPMIWPEFRLHSIAFACRHVASTVISLLGLWGSDSTKVYYHMGIILGTNKIADMITQRWGSVKERTTNAMPYPPSVTEKNQAAIKLCYTQAQFGATASVITGCPTQSFLSVIAIQAAPLLMTLVRKGKIGAETYHAIYTLTLFIPYLAVPYIVYGAPEEIVFDTIARYFVAIAIGGELLRLKYRVNKYLIWASYVLVVDRVMPLAVHPLYKEYLLHWQGGLLGSLFLGRMIISAMSFLYRVRPVFWSFMSDTDRKMQIVTEDSDNELHSKAQQVK